jgi:hypothetical protein
MAICLLMFEIFNPIIRFFMDIISCGDDIFALTV